LIEPGGREGRPFNPWLSRWPLLGPITLATILHERGYDAGVYNENISGLLPENPAAYEDVCSADVVGISIMTPTASRGYALADRIKRDRPKTTVVLGGVHATFVPDEAIRHADVVVRGEGETVIEAIARGDVTRGIIQATRLADLDEIPTLNHALLRDFDRVRTWGGLPNELPVMTSRGCPYGCTYCSVTQMFGRKVRRQSPQKVYQDLRRYAERGSRRVFFYDDNLVSDREWSRRVLRLIAPLGLRFVAQTRADFPWRDAERTDLDTDLLTAMRQAGANMFCVGYETIDDRAAAAWQKGYRGPNTLRHRLEQDTAILRDAGIWVHGMFVLGPQHSQRDADGIVSFARECGVGSIQISVLTPFPGTPLFEQMQPQLLFTRFPEDWDFYDGTHCVYDNSVLGVEGMSQALIRAHQRFYRRSAWNVRSLWRMLREPLPIVTKLTRLRANVDMVGRLMKQWKQETARFIELARSRGVKGLGLAGAGSVPS
jgi:radical SAM superfamily enzyme YgiQ (UPF0313 family)